MLPDKPTSLDDVVAVLRAYFAHELPDCRPDELEVRYFDGARQRQLIYPIKAAPSESRHAAVDDELRNAVIDALDESTEHLKSSTLARKVGRRPAGSFRGLLAKMKADGDITTDADGKYMLPE